MSDGLFLGDCSSANNRAKDRKTPEGKKSCYDTPSGDELQIY
jgi:hypothetical protein